MVTGSTGTFLRLRAHISLLAYISHWTSCCCWL